MAAAETAVETAIGGRTLRLTSLDKVLYPATGFTKRQLIAYYVGIADALLPHIAGRPVTLGRWPSGVDARGFAQMECRGAPEWLRTRPLRLRSGEIRNYCVIDDAPSLVWAANQGTIELHTYLGGGADGEQAVLAVFDLDPRAGAGLLDAAELALALRARLAQDELEGFAKTSGGDGIHVFVPLNVTHAFEQARAFCERVAAELDTRRVAIDCAQNLPRRSLAAPYSLRAATAPSASAPVRWEELEHAVAAGRRDQLVFGPGAMLQRVEELGDVFRPVLELKQRLPA